MGSTKMISVVICTKDRAEELRLTLKSISVCVIPGDTHVEVLVVDNGSTDHTKKVALEADLQTKKLRYLYEPLRGKGNAYNCGIRNSSGDIILFTDDDVRVPKNWIAEMSTAISPADLAAVQGGVLVATHLDRPWLRGALRIWVAAVEDLTNPPESLVGANMAITRVAINKIGEFDARLGPGASGFYDDTAYGWRLAHVGGRIVYRPEIAVTHYFSEDRLRFKAFLDVASRMAVSRRIALQSIGKRCPRPTVISLIRQIGGLAIRGVDQLIALARDGNPKPSFIVRFYYALCRISKNDIV
jgi:glycosyltransferase involved in cell wall biosynthesis